MSISRLTLLLAGLIVLLAIAGIWSGEPLQGFWRWPAALLITLMAWERFRLMDNIELHRQVPATLALGESVGYSIQVCNRAGAKVRFETQSDYPAAIVGDNSLQRWLLGAHETQSRQFSITPTRLGGTSLGSLYVKQLGAFGLCWWTRRIDDDIAMRIEPARLNNFVDLSGMQQLGSRGSVQARSSGVEFLDLSEYRRGDSLRSIDWKATARRGKPMVRHFEREHLLEIAVLIDCGLSSRLQSEHMDRLHHYINVAAKLTEFASYQGDRIACLAYAQQTVDKTPMAGGMNSVRAIRQLLSRLTVFNENGNALNAALEVKQLLKRRGLVIFLTELEQPEAALQLVQAGKLLSTKHQVLVATVDEPAIGDDLKQNGVYWQDPYRKFAILEYLRGRELTRKRLQGSGVAVTSATAQNLDRRILAYYRNKRDTIAAA
ncbi:DUF58 domain-containing protein [Methylomonas sp. LW13]|uniref:DUF58 domain-containing protein n=1 Tax=unclassified Methylomonas TaxID=2608980 RepID=UPI00051C4220|nr:DUF58 domain-containing protein [Methylomonas sp. LW13]QBC29669.1 DUF58 domain-containing protein [Methylomonas sp. LW13]